MSLIVLELRSLRGCAASLQIAGATKRGSKRPAHDITIY